MANTISSTLNAGGPVNPDENNSGVNPLDNTTNAPKSADSDFIKSLVSDSGIQDQNLLEVAPEVDNSLIEEVAPPTSFLLVILKGVFGLLVLAGVASVGFFSLQMTDYLQIINQKFEVPNLATELASKNQEIISAQANINFYRYLQAKAYLDQFSYEADSYLQNYEIFSSSTVSQAERDEAKKNMTALRATLQESFLAAQAKIILPLNAELATVEPQNDDLMTPTIDVSQQFVTESVAKLQEKAAEFANSTDTAARLDYKNYSYAANLVSNSTLKQTMTMMDLSKLSDQQLYDAIRLVDILAFNDFSIIQKIKELRIKWSNIINEIDLRTIVADPNYTKENYDGYGGIRYTSYSFDSDSRQVSVVGETRKSDTTTFTTISNLIDALNKSTLFENAEMRSFSKSGSAEEGYTSSLRISFRLKNSAQNEQMQAAMEASGSALPGEEEPGPEEILLSGEDPALLGM